MRLERHEDDTQWIVEGEANYNLGEFSKPQGHNLKKSARRFAFEIKASCIHGLGTVKVTCLSMPRSRRGPLELYEVRLTGCFRILGRLAVTVVLSSQKVISFFSVHQPLGGLPYSKAKSLLCFNCSRSISRPWIKVPYTFRLVKCIWSVLCCVLGNLVYGEDIRRTLLSNPENRAQYILMQRIQPASINKTLVVRQESMTPVDIISELGIFGIFIRYLIDIRYTCKGIETGLILFFEIAPGKNAKEWSYNCILPQNWRISLIVTSHLSFPLWKSTAFSMRKTG